MTFNKLLYRVKKDNILRRKVGLAIPTISSYRVFISLIKYTIRIKDVVDPKLYPMNDSILLLFVFKGYTCNFNFDYECIKDFIWSVHKDSIVCGFKNIKDLTSPKDVKIFLQSIISNKK